jgi:transposase
MLDHVEAQEADIAALDERIEAALAPFVAQLELLATIPGVDRRSAQVILAEIGPDMAVFPTKEHLASWAGMCPGQRDSAGKHGSGKTRKGSKWLRGALVQSARGAARSKGTYLSERYRQVMRRRGDAKAIVALGHEILLWPCCRRRSLQDLTQYRSSSPLQLLQPIFRVELSDGNRTRRDRSSSSRFRSRRGSAWVFTARGRGSR